MKFGELTERGADAVRAQIQERMKTLRSMLNSSGDRAEHYLLWTNGGAVIALLSFMAASERIRESQAAWHALTLFVAGVVSCGLLCAVNYHLRLILFRRWNADTDKFYAGAIDFEVLFENLNRVATGARARLSPILGWLAFACFVAGASVALTHFVPSASLSAGWRSAIPP